MSSLRALLVLGVLLATGCGSGEPDREPPSPTKPSRGRRIDPIDATGGAIRGQVRFEGEIPNLEPVSMSGSAVCILSHTEPVPDPTLRIQEGRIANVFVFIERGLEGRTFPPPADPVVLDQRGCLFEPRILGVGTDQELRFLNSDPFLHNVSSRPTLNPPFNLALAPGGEPVSIRFKRPEVMIALRCGLHGWMKAHIGVVDHPYFRVTGTDGAFVFPGLPPGTYRVVAWHEVLGRQARTVEVASGEDATLEFILKNPPDAGSPEESRRDRGAATAADE